MPAKNSPKESPSPWGSVQGIRDILDLMTERGISEFELENNGFRLRIKRETPGAAAPELAQGPAHRPHFGIVHTSPEIPAFTPPAAAESPSSGAPGDAEAAAHNERLYVIKSPIVGTFYRASSPDTPEFAKLGDVVVPGQVLCIIEAMKLMNEIEAEVGGTVARIFVENGQPVEYGQALFGLTTTTNHATS